MTNSIFSPDAVMTWHGWVRDIALILIGILILYALLQILAAGKHRIVARRLGGGSLRVSLIAGLTLVGTIPATALGLLLAERSAHHRQDRMQDRLDETAAAVARSVDQYMDKHLTALVSASSAISSADSFDKQALTEWLLLYHNIYADFLTMLSADSEGNIVTATSNMTGFLVPAETLSAHNVADRPYFQQPMSDGMPYISKVFQGRDLGRDPIVAISAPMRDAQGKLAGIIEGSLNLRAFSQLDRDRPKVDQSTLVLVDQHSRVIYATPDAGLIELDSLTADPLISTALTVGPGTSYEYVAENDSGPHRYLGMSAKTKKGWTVYVRVPLDQITQQMISDYRVVLILLIVACILSLSIAASIVRRVSSSVRDMNKAVDSLKIDGAVDKIRTPANTPGEFRPIFRHMRRRSAQLKRTHVRLKNSIEAGEQLRRELTQTIALKEVEIADRMADLEEANARLSSLSRSDALTGVPNRREFDTFEKRLWRSAARKQTPVAIILLDIDFFKIYNDTLGHQEGDSCLRKVATTLNECAARPLDIFARYGGEEFAAILDGSEMDDALVVAERMRRAVFDLQIPHPGSSHAVVTVSAGVVSKVPVPTDSSELAIKAADEALYYAKAAGRNCVVYSKNGEYVTYDDAAADADATNVIAILSANKTKHRTS